MKTESEHEQDTEETKYFSAVYEIRTLNGQFANGQAYYKTKGHFSVVEFSQYVSKGTGFNFRDVCSIQKQEVPKGEYDLNVRQAKELRQGLIC